MGRARKDSSQPKGPSNSYAFFVKQYHEQHRAYYKGLKITFPAMVQQCALAWKALTTEQKAYYDNQAAEDMERYKSEVIGKGVDVTPPVRGVNRLDQKKEKKQKDRNAPLKPMTAFFWFCTDERLKLKERFPEMTRVEISKELGRLWSCADPQVKKRYEFMAQKDKERYVLEKAEYDTQRKEEEETSVGVAVDINVNDVVIHV